MGKRGPKGLSETEVAMTGNAGRRGARADLPAKPLPSIPAPPAILSDQGRQIWANIAADLVGRELLASCDMYSLALLCQSIDTYYKACNDIRENGSVQIAEKSGYEQVRPIVTIRDVAHAQIVKLSEKFGFTPADRVGFGERGTKKKGGLDALSALLGEKSDPPPPESFNAKPKAPAKTPPKRKPPARKKR